MPRPQKKIKKDTVRGFYIGVFHEVVEGTSKRAPQRDLCTLEAAIYKITTKGKKKRNLSEMQKFLSQLYSSKLKDLLIAKKEQESVREKGPKVRDVMQQWLDEVMQFRSKRTVEDYLTSINYYILAVGNHPIQEFKKYYNIDLKSYLEKKKHSTNTVYKHIANMQAFFNWAHEYELSPKIKLKKPLKTKKEPRIYSREQLVEIETFLRNAISNTSPDKEMRKIPEKSNLRLTKEGLIPRRAN